MASNFDALFSQADSLISGQFGEAVEYTDLDGSSVTDAQCLVDCVGDGAIGQTSDPQVGDKGTSYTGHREFGFRRSVCEPKIYGKCRVVSEGDNAPVWTITKIIGSDSLRLYVAAEKRENHERTATRFRGA